MYDLPQKFIERMKTQLPESEWQAFFSCYEKPFVKGVRINTLKGDRYALKAFLPFLEEQIPWEENGYYTCLDKVGASPFHSAGVFYSQEPSAMCVAPLLEVQKGERVLDLCSAPGGKGTQLASRLQGDGLIVLNEPVFSRAKILSQNAERLGVKNAVVTCEMPSALAKKLPNYFDKILVDAPCSGEGMFRKNADEALNEWSEENITLCVARQKEILDSAICMLKKGGRLAYSTCTFSPQEDEQMREWVQNTYPQMRLLQEEKLYPHKIKGEGHFVAVFEKTDGEINDLRPVTPWCSASAEKAYRQFEKDFFREKFAYRLHEVNGVLYDIPKGVFNWNGLQVLRVGVRLGEVKNGRFEPNHSLALCISAGECTNALQLKEDDERVEKYLRGETVECTLKNGWCVVCIEDFPLGLGKVVNGTIKNHLPKGLRKN